MREKNNPPEFRSAVTAAAAAMRCTRYRSARRAAATAGPRVVALLAAMLASAIAAAAPTGSVSTPLSFKTTGQSLFGPGGTATKTESLKVYLLNDDPAPQVKGKIVTTPTEVPVSTLQNIWHAAISKCESYSYTIPVIGTIHPTQSECETGVVHRCVMLAGICTGQYIDYNVGAGIGPEPTQPISKSYKIGVEVSSYAQAQMGLQGAYQYDLGSVDASYTATAVVSVDKTSANEGDIVTLSSAQTPGTPFAMASRYPSFDLSLDMFALAKLGASLHYDGVNYQDGSQIDKTTTLYSVDSANNPAAQAGVMLFSNGKQELFGVHVDTNGMTVRLLGVPTIVQQAKYDTELTWPPEDPKPPTVPTPEFTFPVDFQLAAFSFTAPVLNTPVPLVFDCGMCNGALRNSENLDGSITSTVPIGDRTLIGGITDGNGITLPLVNDGHEDADLARIDFDISALTLAAGVPLGAEVHDPSPLDLFDAEVNLLKLSLASFFSVTQNLNFNPNLMVELHFSVPTEVKGPNDTAFASATTALIPVGSSLQFKQPATNLVITPVYTLRANQFKNDTELKLTEALQETVDQVKLSGTIPDLAASALGQDLNFALLQLTPQLAAPQKIWGTDTTAWSLGGFQDVTGSPLSVETLPASGSGGTGSGGSGAGGSSGGSGGGSGSNSSGNSGGTAASATASGGSGGKSGGGGAFDGLSLALLVGALIWHCSLRKVSRASPK